MKREGRQHGVVRTLMILPSELNPRPAKLFVNRFDSPPAFGVFAKVSSKPTNHSKFTGRCERSKCSDCHASPAKKSANKSKGRRKEQAMASWTEDKLHCLVRSDLSGEDYEALVYDNDNYNYYFNSEHYTTTTRVFCKHLIFLNIYQCWFYENQYSTQERQYKHPMRTSTLTNALMILRRNKTTLNSN